MNDSERKGPESARLVNQHGNAEGKLRWLEMAAEQSIDGIAVADLDGIIQFVNPAWAQMHGYGTAELIGQHLSIFHTEEQLQKEVIPFNEQVQNVGAKQGEVGHVRKDGTPFPTWMTSTLLRDEEGNPIGLVGTARDITKPKQAEEALRESEEQYRRLVETMNEGMGVQDENGVFIWVNDRLCEMFGYSRDEIIGRPLTDFLDKANQRRLK
ncbi:MAG: PAS domain S-box protein, partial [Chloroflexota bacterium]|nr:PAS domain S-box protein [Chloroflexota bacterium]